ncbi:hypothetical protein [Aquimarina sp. MMG016]|uniref:hypothetical protein n=1 Tax=Aquimarina sp. MMG016 TaxID=2822690 RepID=UPI001B3A6E69|nr:hypothetical protein [Aquimarina sp. MMG016]MBQ4820941.1 hypothetical protein [Aquimarina sp. MMG016]
MTTISKTSEKELKEIHLDALAWKSSLQFIEGEVSFIKQLLNSYVFEPTTPNLFERLQEFREKITKVEEEIDTIYQAIRKHESELGGILDCDTVSYDHYHYQNHQLLGDTYINFHNDFQELKSDVFRYAGGILKKKKK